MSKTEIRRIESIERLNNSVYGNPRYRFYLSGGGEYGESRLSMSDAAFCYSVGNPGMRAGDTVTLEFTRAGRIRHMGPYKPESAR